MNRYELMVIISPDLGGDAINKRLNAVRDLITSNKGKIFLEDIWGLRDFAYTIKKFDQGFYTVFYFEIDGQHLQEIDTTLRLENEVLRHLIVSLPAGYEPITMKDKEEQDAKEREAAVVEEKAAPKKSTKKKKSEEEKVAESPQKREKATPDTSAEKPEKKLDDVLDNPDLNF